MMINDNNHISQLGHQRSFKPESSTSLSKPLLELPKIQGHVRNLSNSAASTRRSTNHSISAFGSQLVNTSVYATDCSKNQNMSTGTAELTNYQDSDLSMLQLQEDVNSPRNNNKSQLTEQPKGKLLDRNYLKQLRVEREQRQILEQDQQADKDRSLVFDRDVTIRTRVCHKKAARSLVRMESELKKSMDTIEQFRNWQSNFSGICNKKLNKLAALQPVKQSATIQVAKVQPAASKNMTVTPKQKVLPTATEPRLKPCQMRKAAISQPRQAHYQARRNPFRSYLPEINKPQQLQASVKDN